jgi:hypothetical protein
LPAARPPASSTRPTSSDERNAAATRDNHGAEWGIGAGLVVAFRRDGYAVVATSLSIPASDEPDLFTVQGDITHAETSRRVAEQALERVGRIDTLINNAGVYIGKPFTDYTSDDYAAITAVNLAGFGRGRPLPRYVRIGRGQQGGADRIDPAVPAATDDKPWGVPIRDVFEGMKEAIVADRYAYFDTFLANFYNTDVLAPEDPPRRAAGKLRGGGRLLAVRNNACIDTC